MTDRADPFDRSDFEGRPSIIPVKAGLAVDADPYDYIVQPGDTLERIAEKWLGGALEWLHLYQANRDHIKDPNRIQPGLKLVIPPRREKPGQPEKRVRGRAVPIAEGTKVTAGPARLKRLYLTYKNLPKLEGMRFLKIMDETEQDYTKDEWKKADMEWMKDLLGTPLPLDTGGLYRAYRRLPIAYRMAIVRAAMEKETGFTLDEMNQTDLGKIDPSELEPNHGQGNTI